VGGGAAFEAAEGSAEKRLVRYIWHIGPNTFEEVAVRERWKISFLLSASLLLSTHAIAQMDSSPHQVQMANGNYSADHLGDDVLAGMKALHVDALYSMKSSGLGNGRDGHSHTGDSNG
jgi:hypothetical protein